MDSIRRTPPKYRVMVKGVTVVCTGCDGFFENPVHSSAGALTVIFDPVCRPEVGAPITCQGCGTTVPMPRISEINA